MKITKTQLRQIIKEELTEAGQYGLGVPGGSTRSVADPHTAALAALADYIRKNYREEEDRDLLNLLQTAEEAVVDFEGGSTLHEVEEPETDCLALKRKLRGLYTDVEQYATPGSGFTNPPARAATENEIQDILKKCPGLKLKDGSKGKTSSGLRSMGADRYGE